MPLLKTIKNGEFEEVHRNIRFMKAVQQYSAWNGTKYVDNDDGADGDNGESENAAYLNLQTAINASAVWGKIFIRPRKNPVAADSPNAVYLAGDADYHLPATAANWYIPYTKHGLHLIGCGNGQGQAGQYQTYLRGHGSVTTTPTLDIKAPLVTLENLAFHAGASTVGQVRSKFYDTTAWQSFACTFYKCLFRLADGAGALILDAAWSSVVKLCTFLSCQIGIYIGTSNSVPKRIHIDDCRFQGLTSEIECDIYGVGGVINILMENLKMNHTLPNTGTIKKFIAFAVASTGQFMNSTIGATATTAGTNTTLNGVGYSKIYCGTNIGLMTNA
jgi:hypothetical protein